MTVAGMANAGRDSFAVILGSEASIGVVGVAVGG
jgi:hypothetical protein